MPTPNQERLARLKAQGKALVMDGARTVNMATELARALDAVDARIDLTYEIKKTMKVDAKRKAESEASRLSVDHGKARREYDADLKALKAQPRQPGYGDTTAAEIRRERSWRKLERQLAALPDTANKGAKAQQLLEEAQALGDRDTLEAAHIELASYLDATGDRMPPGLADWLVIQGGSEEGREAVLFDMGHDEALRRAELAVNHFGRQISDSETSTIILPDVDRKVARIIPVDIDHRPHHKPTEDPPTRVQAMAVHGDGGTTHTPVDAA
jgi:hypothetical protein